MNYLANAFSLQMLDVATEINVSIRPIEPTEVPSDAISCIGHADTANVVSDLLGRPVACHRASIALEEDDVLYVAQIMGGRLPEGATTLPEGFSLQFLEVVPYIKVLPY